MNKLILTIAFYSLVCSPLTAQSYQNAESVEYDPVNNRWLVSNSSNIIADDGAGNLSFFGTGATSYGLEILNNTLFGISGGNVLAFDLETEMQIGSVAVPGAGFLNGMTNDGTSTIYVTDFGNRKIFSIDVSDVENMIVEEIVGNTGSTPNGLVYDAENARLLFVSWGSNAAVKAVDLADNSVSTIITTGLGNIDGIDEDNAGNYYLSSWTPNQISKYDNTFANPLEVITTPFISQPADICYARQNDTLAIPIGNNVVFVDLSEAVSLPSLSSTETNFSVYPNPVSDQSFLRFILEEQAQVNLQILNEQGQALYTLQNQFLTASTYTVLFAGHDLPAGIYYARLQIGSQEQTLRIAIIR